MPPQGRDVYDSREDAARGAPLRPEEMPSHVPLFVSRVTPVRTVFSTNRTLHRPDGVTRVVPVHVVGRVAATLTAAAAGTRRRTLNGGQHLANHVSFLAGHVRRRGLVVHDSTRGRPWTTASRGAVQFSVQCRDRAGRDTQPVVKMRSRAGRESAQGPLRHLWTTSVAERVERTEPRGAPRTLSRRQLGVRRRYSSGEVRVDGDGREAVRLALPHDRARYSRPLRVPVGASSALDCRQRTPEVFSGSSSMPHCRVKHADNTRRTSGRGRQ